MSLKSSSTCGGRGIWSLNPSAIWSNVALTSATDVQSREEDRELRAELVRRLDVLVVPVEDAEGLIAQGRVLLRDLVDDGLVLEVEARVWSAE